jgi:hypothetical protein
MSSPRTAGALSHLTVSMLLLLVSTGCAGISPLPVKPARLGESQLGPLSVDPSLVRPEKGGSLGLAPAEPAIQADTITNMKTPIADITPAAVEPGPAPQVAVRAAPPVKAVIAAAPVRKAELPPPAAAPTLDVASLKSRLRDTKAIGVFSKLALKNQMDDVLEQFRAAYNTGQTTAPVALRQPYDLLVLKVLALLQEGDPALARSIAGSREAIWGILSDAAQFRAVA